MNTLKTLLATSQETYFEESSPPTDPSPPTAPPPPTDGMYTQEEVNRIVAKDRRNLQTKLEAKTKALTDAQASISMTEEERLALQSKVEELGATMLTVSEVAKRDKKRAAEASQLSIETSKAEAASWKKKFQTTVVESALMKAASIEGQQAFNPTQIINLFREDVIFHDDGTLKVKVVVEGKSLELDPEAAIKEYASRTEYSNLFVVDGKIGLGKAKPKYTQQRGNTPTTMAEYKANRASILEN